MTLSESYDRSLIETCSHFAHTALRIFREQQGDFRHKPWDQLTDAEKEPARKATIGIVYESMGPQQVHEAWRAMRTAERWTFGTMFNVATKEHPCMVSWTELRFEDQKLNELFCDAVIAMKAALMSMPNQ